MNSASDGTRASVSGSQGAAPGGSPRVLIVDDEPVIRLMLGTYLSQHGWKCLSAESPPAATRLLRDEPISHAIIDIHLGEFSGFDLLRLLHRERPEIRLVAITGSITDDFRAALDAGASAVLGKPMTALERLLDALEGRISGSESRDELLH